MLCSGVVAQADMYQYTDQSGTVCLTNDLANVPPAKRKTVKVIREEPKPKARQATVDPAASDPPSQQPQASAVAGKPSAPLVTTTNSSSPRKLVGIATGMLAALFLVARLTRSLSSPQLAKVIYVAFFLGTFVFGYKLYADHLVNGYFAIKSKMLTLFAKAQQREELPPPRPRTGETEQ